VKRALPLLLALAACDAAPAPTPAVASPPAAPAPAKTFSFEGRALSDLDEEVTLELAAVDPLPPCWGGPRKPVQRFTAQLAPGESFRFEGLHPGAYWVTASSRSSAMHDYFQTTVTNDVHAFEVHVRRACRLRVHVTFGEGIDPADCWLRYDIATGGFDQPRGLPRSGRFEVSRLEPGQVGVLVRHWPDRGPDGAEPALRVESYVKAVLVPGDNDVEIRIDANSPHVK
jgi:hypothetical protein